MEIIISLNQHDVRVLMVVFVSQISENQHLCSLVQDLTFSNQRLNAVFSNGSPGGMFRFFGG
jgi:hypothetical protein